MGSTVQDRFDDEWLSAALGEPVQMAYCVAVDAGLGLLADVWRVELTNGRRVVVKRPAADAQTRSIADRFGYYVREAGTYRLLLPGRDVPAPRCLAVVDTADGPALVIEDLFHHRSVDQLTGADLDHALTSVDALAAVHASFWNDPILAASTWLPGPDDAVVAMYDELFAMTIDSFEAMVDGLIPTTHLRAARQAMTKFGDVLQSFAQAPRTLVHGDYRIDNLLFAPDGSAIAIDWQLAAWGRGAYDLAFFASGSIDDRVLAATEAELVGRYHRQLVHHGIDDYPFEACWRDYLGGLIMNLPNPVTALVAVPPRTERGARLLRENARRALATVARHASSLSSW